MATNINGLTYYKLDSNLHGYPGDITKNSGLRGEEIDANFNFLRGKDIKSVSFDDAGTLTITKYDGEILTANQIPEPETPDYTFSYNADKGVLTIITPKGEEVVLEGFNIASNVHADVYHDNSLVGVGSKDSILQLNNICKTGRYLPAIKLIDTTLINEEGIQIEKLPTENIALHDRYVTKENYSVFGRLYNVEGMEKINAKLKSTNSEWHVPTKEEWDELLNVIDYNTPNHDSIESNKQLGEFAGAILKSTQYWETLENGKLLSEDTYGFSILPVGYCGNRGRRFFGSFGLSSAFWTSTVEGTYKDMYVKSFDFDKETVGQNSWSDNYYLSIRLVKKFNGTNFNASEVIDGFVSNCVHVPGTTTIWTKENIAFSQEEYNSFVPQEWNQYQNAPNIPNSSNYRYFVNDWNGTSWDKHEIKEGEGIVLYDGKDGAIHEWLLINGELIDSVGLVVKQTQARLEVIDGEVDELKQKDSEIDAAVQQLHDDLTLESQNREQNIQTVTNEINNLKQKDSEIDAAVQQLHDSLTTETQNREQKDSEIDVAVQQLRDDLTLESQNREQDKEALIQRIEEENNSRENNVTELQKTINENKVKLIDNSLVLVDGYTDENGETKNTTIKVKLDGNCEHIKLDENGIYFDGCFGTF